MVGIERVDARSGHLARGVRVLKHKSLLVREERVLDTADQRIAELRELVDAVREGLPIESRFLDQANIEELPNSALLQRLAPILDELAAAAANAVSTLEQAQATATAASADVRKDWEQKSEEADETGRKIRSG